MVFPSLCSNEECIVASTSEATASSSVFKTKETIITGTSKFSKNDIKLKKKKNRTSRWEPKSVEYINNNSKSNIDLINFQRNIIVSNSINQNNIADSISNNYSNKIETFVQQKPSPTSSVAPTLTTNFVSIPSPFNAIPNFPGGFFTFNYIN